MAASVLLALIAASCSTAEPLLGPYDADAEIQPELITLVPSPASAGDLVSILFPDERNRGVHYVLESHKDDTWNLEYHLVSDWQGEKPPASQKVEASGTTWAIPDIGFDGPGPDLIVIPADAEAGEYRICTGNTRPNICALLTIVASP